MHTIEAIAVTDLILKLCDAASSDDVRLAALAQAVRRMCKKLDVPVDVFVLHIKRDASGAHE